MDNNQHSTRLYNMKRYKLLFYFLLPLLIAPVAIVIQGCNTTQQRIAYNTLYGLEQTVTAANAQYLDMVIAGKVPTNDVPKIAKIYNDFQAGFAVAADAARYSTNALAPGNLTVIANDLLAAISTAKGGK